MTAVHTSHNGSHVRRIGRPGQRQTGPHPVRRAVEPQREQRGVAHGHSIGRLERPCRSGSGLRGWRRSVFPVQMIVASPNTTAENRQTLLGERVAAGEPHLDGPLLAPPRQAGGQGGGVVGHHEVAGAARNTRFGGRGRRLRASISTWRTKTPAGCRRRSRRCLPVVACRLSSASGTAAAPAAHIAGVDRGTASAARPASRSR